MSSISNNNNNAAPANGGWWGSLQRGWQAKQEEMRAVSEAKSIGKVYMKETKTWEFYFLDAEWVEIEKEENALKQQQNGKISSNSSNDGEATTTTISGKVVEERPVKDREYYDLLEVSTSATATDIKKAYRKMARNCHPAKCPGDEDAHARFHELGHAGHVLSSPYGRAYYDKNGKEPSSNGSYSNANQQQLVMFVNVIIGTELVSPYIGEFCMATRADNSEMLNFNNDDLTLEELKQLASEESKFQQRKRPVQCAKNLRDRITSYKKENPQPFIDSVKHEAEQIVHGDYGEVYCKTIGFSLLVAAEQYIGFENTLFGVGGHLAKIQQDAASFGVNIKLLGSRYKTLGAKEQARSLQQQQQEQQQQKEQNDGGTTASTADVADADEEQQKAAAAAMQMQQSIDDTFLEHAWAANKRDIKSTLKEVCRKLLDDAGIPKYLRLDRAEALRIMGREFHAAGTEAARQNKINQLQGGGGGKDSVHDDIKARFAVVTMANNAQGQEMTREDHQEELTRPLLC